MRHPRDRFLEIADRYTACSGPDRTATICYAVGLTQHSVGAQIVRSAAILQLLLGNIGRPGGGVLALRGHASIQGSTDIPTLYDLLPGYLPMPEFGAANSTLGRYIVRHRAKTGWWAHLDKYIVSLLKAWYGDAASVDNDFGFGWLPRISGDHSHQGYWLEMADGRMDGLFVMGQNPAVGAPNAALERRALANLEWLVVRDMVEVETATFWKDSPEVRRGELRPEQIKTEVFFFPAAGHAEKDGSSPTPSGCCSGTRRRSSRRAIADPTVGSSTSLASDSKRVRPRDTRPCNDGLRALTWDYPTRGPHGEPDAEAVLREINGYRTSRAAHSPMPTTRPEPRYENVTGFTDLAADGSTACGCWIYAGVFPRPDENRARARAATGP